MKLIYTCLLGLLLLSCTSSTKRETPKHVKPVHIEFFEMYTDLHTNWIAAISYSEQADTSSENTKKSVSAFRKKSLGQLIMFGSGNYKLVKPKDKAKVDSILSIPEIRNKFPENLQFAFSDKPEKTENDLYYLLYAIHPPFSKKDRITGKDIQTIEARFNPDYALFYISIEFTPNGTRKLGNLTAKSLGKGVAVVVDDQVINHLGFRQPIYDGKVQLYGNFTQQEVDGLVMALQAGK